MSGNRRSRLLLIVIVSACSQQPVADLATSLKGIDQSRFLACSGPPILSYTKDGREHMSFVTDLKRGAPIGVSSPTALPPQSCSVDAVFVDHRLADSVFSGSASMCSLVFSPCLPR